MANLSDPSKSTGHSERCARAARRSCGSCSLCCSILRVDPLGKTAGENCVHQRILHGAGHKSGAVAETPGGCAIHAERPAICRGYRCLWLQGGLEDDERPDQTGGIVDLEPGGDGAQLQILETEPERFDESVALHRIVDRFRSEMPVRVVLAGGFDDPDRPFRIYESGGREKHVAGEWITLYQDGREISRQRQPWAERMGRRFVIAWRARSIARLRTKK